MYQSPSNWLTHAPVTYHPTGNGYMEETQQGVDLTGTIDKYAK